jgi:hypothetical protein
MPMFSAKARRRCRDVFAATCPLLTQIGGVYLRDNDVSPLDDGPKQLTADSIPSDVTSSPSIRTPRSVSGS